MKHQLHIYLHAQWREAAARGEVNLFRRMQLALPDWQLHFHLDSEEERDAASGRGYGLFHMQPPNGPQILNLRKAYMAPFWRIEAVAERWEFDVALAPFRPDDIPPGEATGFVNRWRPQILGPDFLGAAPIRRDGHVLVPLQGRISQHRSFQSMSPLAMLKVVLDRIPKKPILVTLHPKEVYTPADLAALDQLAARFPRLRLTAAGPEVLAGCDLVVTQNSSVALHGFFAGKPAVLFAGSDFHHIAGSVWRDGVDKAFAALEGPTPDFAAYLCWFFRHQAINGGAPDCEAQIRGRFRRHGWPV